MVSGTSEENWWCVLVPDFPIFLWEISGACLTGSLRKAPLANILDNFSARRVGFGQSGVRSMPQTIVTFGLLFLTGDIFESHQMVINFLNYRDI